MYLWSWYIFSSSDPSTFPCCLCYYIIFSAFIKSLPSLTCGDIIVKHQAKCNILWGKTKEAKHVCPFSFILPDYLILFGLVFLSFHRVMYWPGYHTLLRSGYPSDFRLLGNGSFRGKHSPWWQRGPDFPMREPLCYIIIRGRERVFVA